LMEGARTEMGHLWRFGWRGSLILGLNIWALEGNELCQGSASLFSFLFFGFACETGLAQGLPGYSR
jgi:hypothetical protein